MEDSTRAFGNYLPVICGRAVHKDPSHHARDTRAKVKASLDPRVGALLLFANLRSPAGSRRSPSRCVLESAVAVAQGHLSGSAADARKSSSAAAKRHDDRDASSLGVAEETVLSRIAPILRPASALPAAVRPPKQPSSRLFTALLRRDQL
jgi:hypothetical protein